MARVDFDSAAHFEGIAEPHQSTVAAIVRALEQGLFTAAEAGLLIDRVRMPATEGPVQS
jgi:hypothetical protein